LLPFNLKVQARDFLDHPAILIVGRRDIAAHVGEHDRTDGKEVPEETKDTGGGGFVQFELGGVAGYEDNPGCRKRIA
jgi:hypothetical protein